MDLYEEFTQKQIRTITRDINLIFSLNGFLFPKTIDEIKEIGFFAPRIKINNREIYLSQDGRVALRRICDLTHQSKKFTNLLNYNDVFHGVLAEIERWINDSLIPDAHEFIEPLDRLLSSKINDYVFVCRVDGISLGDGVDSVDLGRRVIKNYEQNILSGIPDISDPIRNSINKEYDNNMIIIGYERGSQSVAQEKFFHNSELSLSILRLYSCALNSLSIHRINIRLINNCVHSHGPASSFGWIKSNRKFTFTRYFKAKQDFKIDNELFNYLTSKCFFKEMSALIDRNNRNELEDAVVKSLFWIGEAQKDYSHPSAWVKLWSCLECFFTLSEDEITERNARGISSILVYGGYSHEKYDDYIQLKKKIKKYYRLRSRIVHRADYTHIDEILLEELSYMVAWVIITMVSLLSKGYTGLDQIQVQAERLDRMHNMKS